MDTTSPLAGSLSQHQRLVAQIIRTAMPARFGGGSVSQPKAVELLDIPVRMLPRRVEEPPGSVHLAPLRDELKRGHGNFDFTSIRERRHDPGRSNRSRGKIPRMSVSGEQSEAWPPESSGKESWAG